MSDFWTMDDELNRAGIEVVEDAATNSDEDDATAPKRHRTATVQVACEPCRKKV
jgi:hypothetical protein